VPNRASEIWPIIEGLSDSRRDAMERRFWSKVDKTSDCWNWLGNTSYSQGYGNFGLGGVSRRAHRVAWAMRHRRDPDPELSADHLCRNRGCVNPDHLEMVAQQVNVIRGESFSAINVVKTHCPEGHEYSPENTYMHRNMRHCKRCRRDAARRWRSRHTPGCTPRASRSN
jgi:hypothetical protein